MDMYNRESEIVRRRWERKDRFQHQLQLHVFRDITLIAIIIVITAAISDIGVEGAMYGLMAFFPTLWFGKWLLNKGD